MTHRPTGISVLINGRSQFQNKENAREILESRVRDEHNANLHSSVSSQKQAQLTRDKRRTYNFIEGRVTDHVTGKRTDKIKKLMKGNLNLIS